MKIRVVGHGGESLFSFGTSGPWCQFRDELISQGHEICVEEYGVKCDALIAHKHSKEALREANKFGIPTSRRALVLWEPEVVEKERYQTDILENYGVIFAPSTMWAQKVDGTNFNWPQDKVEAIESFEKWIIRKQKIAIIQGNKFSARKGELYSLRRKVIKDLESEIQLFGTNWNRGFRFDWLHWSMSALNSSIREISLNSILGIGRKYQNYFGTVANKHEVFGSYRISLVIENSADFVSEKLFDSVSSGNLVIYVGPNLLDFGLDLPSLVVAEPNKKDIRRKFEEIINLSDRDQYSMAKSQNLELRKQGESWENTKVLRNLASDILTKFE